MNGNLWHGIVDTVTDRGVYVTIPRILGPLELIGPCLSAVAGLVNGDRVVGALIGADLSDPVILARAEASASLVGTSDATPGTVMRRDADGSTAVQSIYLNGTATAPNRAVAKAELDGHTHALAALTGRLNFDQLPAFPEIPASTSLNAYVTDGTFHQSQSVEATTALSYPVGLAGLLEVKVSTASFIYQTYTAYNNGKVYTRTRYNNAWSGWREVMSAAELTALLNGKAAAVHTHLWADITDKPVAFNPTAHSHPWSEITGAPATFTPSAHTHIVNDISDSTAVGKSLMRAADAAAARAAIGAGTSSLVVGTGATDAMAGNRVFAYSEITGIVPTSALPPLAINETFQPASQAAMLALTAQRGDMAIRTDNGLTYVLSTDSPGTLADWKQIMAAGQVQSVAGKTGVVSLVKADVGLGSVDNTADSAKPVSTAQQAALNGKANMAHTHNAADISAGTLDPARLPLATTLAAGAMIAADKAKLDASTASGTASALVIRDASGRAQFADPSAAADAATKGYVDAANTGPWVALTLLNAWVPYTGGGYYYSGLRARIVGKMIQIQGMVKSGAVASAIANFPSDMIPTDSAIHLVAAGTVATPRQVGYLLTSVTGRGVSATVHYDAGPAAPAFVSIDILTPLYEP